MIKQATLVGEQQLSKIVDKIMNSLAYSNCNKYQASSHCGYHRQKHGFSNLGIPFQIVVRVGFPRFEILSEMRDANKIHSKQVGGYQERLNLRTYNRILEQRTKEKSNLSFSNRERQTFV